MGFDPNYWLWSIDATDEDLARNMAISGNGKLLESIFDP